MNSIEIYESLSKRQKEQFQELTELLIEENTRCNLTRITEPDQIMSRHILDSLVAVSLLNDYASKIGRATFLIDIGSGAGFPVIPLAIALPDWNFVSVDATAKKIDFQRLVADKLSLDNIELLQERAEELAHDEEYRQRFDFATTRAVGSLNIIAELSAAFIRKGGIFLTWKGPKVEQELTAGKKALEVLGMSQVRQLPYNLHGAEHSNCRLLEAKKVKNTPSKYPRPFKDIKAAPLNFAHS